MPKLLSSTKHKQYKTTTTSQWFIHLKEEILPKLKKTALSYELNVQCSTICYNSLLMGILITYFFREALGKDVSRSHGLNILTIL